MQNRLRAFALLLREKRFGGARFSCGGRDRLQIRAACGLPQLRKRLLVAQQQQPLRLQSGQLVELAHLEISSRDLRLQADLDRPGVEHASLVHRACCVDGARDPAPEIDLVTGAEGEPVEAGLAVRGADRNGIDRGRAEIDLHGFLRLRDRHAGARREHAADRNLEIGVGSERERLQPL